jgi:23S rRNA (uridine2552-2'-O)-methyltransferase
MAPKTTGIKVRDQSRSYDLAERAISLCDSLLAPKGNLLLKVFEGPDLPKLIDLIRKRFQKAERLRPDSTRQASTEIYLIGINKK